MIEEDEDEEEYASLIEALFTKYLAGEFLSGRGKTLIILLWIFMIAFSIVGAS